MQLDVKLCNHTRLYNWVNLSICMEYIYGLGMRLDSYMSHLLGMQIGKGLLLLHIDIIVLKKTVQH